MTDHPTTLTAMHHSYVSDFETGYAAMASCLRRKLDEVRLEARTSHLTRFALGLTFEDVRTRLRTALNTDVTDATSSYPDVLGTTPFLRAVASAFVSFAADYATQEAIDFFIESELPNVRSQHRPDVPMIPNAPLTTYVHSSLWSEGLIAQWLGAATYLGNPSYNDISALLAEIGTSEGNDIPQEHVGEKTEQTDNRSPLLSNKQSVALLMTLLYAAIGEGVLTVNIEAMCRLVNAMTGLNADNTRKELRKWRRSRLYDYNGDLEHVRTLLADLKVNLDLSDLDAAIEQGHKRRV